MYLQRFRADHNFAAQAQELVRQRLRDSIDSKQRMVELKCVAQAAQVAERTCRRRHPVREMTKLLRTNRNEVGGNVQIVKNLGGVTVNTNTVDGALRCK